MGTKGVRGRSRLTHSAATQPATRGLRPWVRTGGLGTIRGERRQGEVLITVDGSPLGWRGAASGPSTRDQGLGGAGAVLDWLARFTRSGRVKA